MLSQEHLQESASCDARRENNEFGNEPSVEEMARSLFILGISSEAELADVLAFEPGCVILTLRLFQTTGLGFDPRRVRALARKIHAGTSRPLVAVDHEMGRFLQLLRPAPRGHASAEAHEVKELAHIKQRFTEWPTMHEMGQAVQALKHEEQETLAARVGAALGRELRACGVDITWAPVVDVARQHYHYNTIGRSLGGDSALVGRVLGAMVRGMQGQGIAACPKHYPGMGAAAADSHYSVPEIHTGAAELRAVDLAAFKLTRHARCMMTNHAVYKALDKAGGPATTSRTIMTDILRGEVGFNGVCVSDDLGMAGVQKPFNHDMGQVVVAALRAGVDMVMLSYRVQEKAVPALTAVLAAVKSGHLSLARLREAYQRTRALREDLLQHSASRGKEENKEEEEALWDAEAHAALAVEAGLGDVDRPRHLSHTVGSDYPGPNRCVLL